jgi:hypothetical protein
MNELSGAEFLPGKEIATTDIEVIRSERGVDDLGHGAEGTVTRVIVRREGREEVLALKETNQQVSALQDNWIVRDVLFNAGLPTLETYVLLFENDKAVGVLMEDLTEGGRNFVLSSNEMKLIRYRLHSLVRRNFTLVQAMANIPDSVIEEMRSMMEDFATISSYARVKCEHQDFMFWIITPNGEVRPVIADLGSLKYKRTDGAEVHIANNLKFFRASLEPLIRLREIAKEVIEECTS